MVEKQAREETVVENATPDYAAGLVSTQVKTKHQRKESTQSNKRDEKTTMHVILKLKRCNDVVLSC